MINKYCIATLARRRFYNSLEVWFYTISGSKQKIALIKYDNHETIPVFLLPGSMG